MVQQSMPNDTHFIVLEKLDLTSVICSLKAFIVQQISGWVETLCFFDVLQLQCQKCFACSVKLDLSDYLLSKLHCTLLHQFVPDL
jgi:hypothetical protein